MRGEEVAGRGKIRVGFAESVLPGLQCLRESRFAVGTERNSERWVEGGCIEKQQVSAASRHSESASQRYNPFLNQTP